MTAGELGLGKKGGGEPEGECEASATVGTEPQPENNQTYHEANLSLLLCLG